MNEVCFVSQENKCRVAVDLRAASKIRVEHRVSLPDHVWLVADRHKLISSVYAGIHIMRDCFGNKEAVGFSCPAYTAMVSGKQQSSTIFSHGCDFEKLLNMEESEAITGSGISLLVKPVFVLPVDGGPDENPRYQNVIKFAFITLFRTILSNVYRKKMFWMKLTGLNKR